MSGFTQAAGWASVGPNVWLIQYAGATLTTDGSGAYSIPHVQFRAGATEQPIARCALYAQSRGALVADFLQGNLNATDYLTALAKRADGITRV